jgi:DDE domain
MIQSRGSVYLGLRRPWLSMAPRVDGAIERADWGHSFNRSVYPWAGGNEIGCQQKNVSPEQYEQGAGDCWTWVAIDADSKLVVSYMLGDRGAGAAEFFMKDVAKRIDHRIQLTTDGHRAYAEAFVFTIL